MHRFFLVFPLFVLALSCGVSSEVSRQLGARCDGHDECDELCLNSARYPGGMCSLACDLTTACPAAGACVDLLEGVCLYTCDTAVDCEFLGVGWTCLEEAGHPDSQVQVKVCIGSE